MGAKGPCAEGMPDLMEAAVTVADREDKRPWRALEVTSPAATTVLTQDKAPGQGGQGPEAQDCSCPVEGGAQHSGDRAWHGHCS